MSDARFFVPPDHIGKESIRVTGDDVNHIKNVLRMRQGDIATLTCGRGTDYICRMSKASEGSEVVFIIDKEIPIETELSVRITLFQALPKKDKMDLIVEKAVELGACEIVPMITKRSVVRYDKEKSDKKTARWRKISESAAKQSGRGLIPTVSDIMSFEQAVEKSTTNHSILIPYEMCDDIHKSLASMKEAITTESIAVFIGSEGGFEKSEVDKVIKAGGKEISLGRRILRTETAGMSVLSMLMFMIEGNC